MVDTSSFTNRKDAQSNEPALCHPEVLRRISTLETLRVRSFRVPQDDKLGTGALRVTHCRETSSKLNRRRLALGDFFRLHALPILRHVDLQLPAVAARDGTVEHAVEDVDLGQLHHGHALRMARREVDS